jgi:hypothetical protein
MSIHTMSEHEWEIVMRYQTEENLEDAVNHFRYTLFFRLGFVPFTERGREIRADSEISMICHRLVNAGLMLQEYRRRSQLIGTGC